MDAALIIAKCFHARTTAHLLHLQTRSYAAHKALNEFYDGIVDLTDSFAETFQGEQGVIDSYPTAYRHYNDALKMLGDLRQLVESERGNFSTHLANILDEILSLIDATTYKLKFLK